MTLKDAPHVQPLLNKFLKKYKMAPYMSLEEVEHWFLPRDGVVHGYVVEVKYAVSHSEECNRLIAPVKNQDTHEITDFVSFYIVSSTILNHPIHKRHESAYMFYYATTEVDDLKGRIQQLMKDILILAKKVYHNLTVS